MSAENESIILSVRVFSEHFYMKRAVTACMVATGTNGTVEHSTVARRDDKSFHRGHLIVCAGASANISRFQSMLTAILDPLGAHHEIDMNTDAIVDTSVTIRKTMDSRLVREYSSGHDLTVINSATPAVPSAAEVRPMLAAAVDVVSTGADFIRAPSLEKLSDILSVPAPDFAIVKTVSYGDVRVLAQNGSVAEILRQAQVAIKQWPAHSSLFLLRAGDHDYDGTRIVALSPGQELFAYGTHELAAIPVRLRGETAGDTGSAVDSGIGSSQPTLPALAVMLQIEKAKTETQKATTETQKATTEEKKLEVARVMIANNYPKDAVLALLGLLGKH